MDELRRDRSENVATGKARGGRRVSLVLVGGLALAGSACRSAPSDAPSVEVARQGLSPAGAAPVTLAERVLPNVCATWSHALPSSLAWLVGDFEQLDDAGRATGERLRITEDRVWFTDADPAKPMRTGTPYFHPSEPELCLVGMPLPATLRLRWPASDPGAVAFQVPLDMLTEGIFDTVSGEPTTLHFRRVSAPPAPATAPAGLEAVIRQGTLQDLEQVLRGGVDANAPLGPDSPLRPLELATQLGQVRMVQRLLEAGAKPDEAGESTPLVAAAELQDARLVRILLAAGASPLTPGHYGRLPLVAAAVPLVPGVLEPLLAAMPTLNHAAVDELAYIAIHDGNREVLQRLLSGGWKPSREDLRHPVLEVAASAEKWDVFAFLAEAGANTAAPTGYDELPLLFDAVEKGNLKYVDALLQARADVNVRDSRGRTPLWLAVEQPIVLERLIRAGAALDVKSAGGDTILHHAARVASPEIVSRLAMAAPQLLGERNSTGRTPLLVASAEGRENIEAALRPLQPAPAAGTGARPPAPNRPPSSTPASEFVITRAGVASRGPDTRIRIDENTAQIEARLGTLFAVEWNIPRVPGLAQLHMSVDIDHPPFPGVSGPESTHFHTEFARPSNAAGYPDLYAWSMDKPAELQPGTWRFVVQVYRDEARTDQLYMAEHTFEVATVP